MYKILNIVPLPFFVDRGGPVRVYEEARALESIGNEVTTYAYHLGRNMPNLEIKRIPNIPWYKNIDVGANFHKIYLDGLLFLRTLPGHLKNDYDIIHAHLHEGAAIGYMLKKIKRRPLILDVQGSLTQEMINKHFISKDSKSYRFWLKVEHFLDERADALITSTSETALTLKTKFAIDPDKIFVVKDGVNTNEFTPKQNTDELKALAKKLGLPLNKTIVVYLGVLSEFQGTDLLLKAIYNVTRKNKGVHFLIMGYPNVDYYKRMASHLGILDYVTFTGAVNYLEAPKYLALGSIAVSTKIPESSEGNGKLYNYMAMGLPSVVFEHDVNKEILGELGIYAKKVDEISFANAIEAILYDNVLRQRLSIKLREKAVDEYSWTNAAKKIMNVYEFVSKS